MKKAPWKWLKIDIFITFKNIILSIDAIEEGCQDLAFHPLKPRRDFPYHQIEDWPIDFLLNQIVQRGLVFRRKQVPKVPATIQSFDRVGLAHPRRRAVAAVERTRKLRVDEHPESLLHRIWNQDQRVGNRVRVYRCNRFSSKAVSLRRNRKVRPTPVKSPSSTN